MATAGIRHPPRSRRVGSVAAAGARFRGRPGHGFRQWDEHGGRARAVAMRTRTEIAVGDTRRASEEMRARAWHGPSGDSGPAGRVSAGKKRRRVPAYTPALRQRRSGAWGLRRLELPERQRGPHPLLARGSNTGGRNRSSDPPVYGPRGSPRGSYAIRNGAIPKMPCREDLLRGAEAPRMEPRRMFRMPDSLLCSTRAFCNPGANGRCRDSDTIRQRVTRSAGPPGGSEGAERACRFHKSRPFEATPRETNVSHPRVRQSVAGPAWPMPWPAAS